MKTHKQLAFINIFAAVFLLSYLIAGIYFTADYGVNWDDNAQHQNGMNNWEFITGQNTQHLKESLDRYHGPAFEIVLIAVEKTLHLNSYHAIFLARHHCVLIFFIIGAGFFFLLAGKLFQSSWAGLAAMFMLILSPRIFGEAFYNPKDIPFLVTIILLLYSLFLLCHRLSFLYILFHAFTCAFAIDIRLIGIVFVPVTIFTLLISHSKQNKAALYSKTALYLAVLFLFMLLMWPILTLGPFTQIAEAYKQLSYYPWDGINRYMGHGVSAMKSPWHYHWVWLLITVPEAYSVLFLLGAVMLCINCFKRSFLHQFKNVFLLLCFFLFLFPLVFRSISKATVLDGWRHVYFVFPMFILVAVAGLQRLIASGNKVVRAAAIVLLLGQMADSAIQIITMHPFEYVYFNHIANTVFKPIDQNFEIDYWGVSYKQGLEYLIANDSNSEKIKVCFKNKPGYFNYDFLSAVKREKIEPANFDEANYLLTNNRDEAHYIPLPAPGKLVHQIKAQGNTVMSVYKLR